MAGCKKGREPSWPIVVTLSRMGPGLFMVSTARVHPYG